jgi:hypothetical protein
MKYIKLSFALLFIFSLGQPLLGADKVKVSVKGKLEVFNNAHRIIPDDRNQYPKPINVLPFLKDKVVDYVGKKVTVKGTVKNMEKWPMFVYIQSVKE